MHFHVYLSNISKFGIFLSNALFYISGELAKGPASSYFKHDVTPVKTDVDLMKSKYNTEILKTRVNTLSRGCRSKRSHLGMLAQSQQPGHFYQSKKANFTVCKVAKSGSTFWATLYIILEKGLNAKNVLQLPRYKIHKYVKSLSFKKLDKQKSAVNIIVARDPYSRLYSAYIDKIYLPAFPPTALAALKNAGHKEKVHFNNETGGSCGYATSFQDFLDYVADASTSGGYINEHWSPVSLMCHACQIEYNFVALQDTLTPDTEYVVNNLLNLSQAQKNNTSMMFHGQKGSQKTMRGVLYALLSHQEDNHDVCPHQITHLYKLWNSLKMQGYIPKDIPFPLNHFGDHRTPSHEKVIKLFLDTMKKFPMSKRAKMNQRREYLVDAYKQIPEKTIRKIQKVYDMDFKLFNFNKNPPK